MIINSSKNSASQTVGNYTFSNYTLDNSGIMFTRVIGEITNNGSAKRSVAFKVNFYDAGGKLLGTATGVVLDLDPGQKKSFEAVADKKLDGVSTFTFQVDAEL
ncbi:FxLYD domain-containing protein [Effusibacillus pohliae]|uniref:FxLYD domain-containing protein n=1 Tax=Effusibacillus pohliae TaxID=232270 RepID=UPI0003800B66|nr:FxLYD domain-containing protein [Effusibacillus pohliae]